MNSAAVHTSLKIKFMRQITLIIDSSVANETFDELRQVQVDNEVIATYEAIYDLNPLDDGTAVELVRLTGDIERLVRITTELTNVSVIPTSETGFVYIHLNPGNLDKALIDIIDTHKVTVDWPVKYTEQGFQLTLLGEDTALQHVAADLSEIVDVTIKKTGDYHPRMRDPAWHLTDRQIEVVRAAITDGYYDLPRETSQRDLAAKLELSRGTVAEHLRKAEARVMQEIVK